MHSAVLVQLAGVVVTAVSSSGAVYAGIRADLKAQKERIGRVEQDVSRAHTRIDRQLDGRNYGAPQAAYTGPR